MAYGFLQLLEEFISTLTLLLIFFHPFRKKFRIQELNKQENVPLVSHTCQLNTFTSKKQINWSDHTIDVIIINHFDMRPKMNFFTIGRVKHTNRPDTANEQRCKLFKIFALFHSTVN